MQKSSSYSHYYDRQRRRGRMLSALLHFAFIMLAITGLPAFLTPPAPEEPVVISVEILPITGITNVKPSDSQPAPETKPEEKQTEQKKPSPPVKTSENTAPPPPDTTEEEKAKEKAEALKKAEAEKKKKEKEEQKKKKKEQEDALNAVLKAVKTTAQKEKDKDKKKPDDKKEDTSPSKSTSNNYNPSMPMSLSEKDAIMSQIAKCWTVPAGAKDAQNLVIVLNAEYNSDGSYIRVELANESRSRYNSDTFFRTAAESAIRAVKECSPLKNLPPQKYDTWRQMELRFDPHYMLN